MLAVGESGQSTPGISVLFLRTACESIVIIIKIQLNCLDLLLRVNNYGREDHWTWDSLSLVLQQSYKK